MAESRSVTNWLSLRKVGRRCVLQVTLQAGGDGTISLHRPLTLEQLRALIGAAKHVAKQMEEGDK